MKGIDLELNRDNVATDIFRSDYDAVYQLHPTVCFSNSGCGIPSDCEVDKENHLNIEIPDGIYHVCFSSSLSPAKIAHISTLRASGYTNEEIAKKLGVSTSTIIKYMKGAN